MLVSTVKARKHGQNAYKYAIKTNNVVKMSVRATEARNMVKIPENAAKLRKHDQNVRVCSEIRKTWSK